MEYGFSQLMCTQPDCNEKAVMCYIHNTDIPVELYCEEHSNSFDHLSEGINYLDAEMKKYKSILESLERLLVVVQEQMEYLVSENVNKDMIEFNSFNLKLYEEYEDLK